MIFLSKEDCEHVAEFCGTNYKALIDERWYGWRIVLTDKASKQKWTAFSTTGSIKDDILACQFEAGDLPGPDREDLLSPDWSLDEIQLADKLIEEMK